MNISSADDAILIFSFLGYETQEIPLGDQDVLTITLPESTEGLDEVIVVGYGTQKKQI